MEEIAAATQTLTLGAAILGIALSDVTLCFDNALANSQMASGLPRKQQKTAIFFGLLLSCAVMVMFTFGVVWIRDRIGWVRYPAGLWLLYVVYKMWFEEAKEHAPHEVGRALFKAILMITVSDLTLMLDNAIANSEFASRAGKENVFLALMFGLLISCTFMIVFTMSIVWIRRYVEWVRYPGGGWLFIVAWMILTGNGHGEQPVGIFGPHTTYIIGATAVALTSIVWFVQYKRLAAKALPKSSDPSPLGSPESPSSESKP